MAENKQYICNWAEMPMASKVKSVDGFHFLAYGAIPTDFAKALQQTKLCDSIFVPDKSAFPAVIIAQKDSPSPTRS